MLRLLALNSWLTTAMILIAIVLFPLHEAITTDYTSSNGTKVYTDITKDTVWTRDGSPYMVLAPIIIHENATLRIEPGVVVVFNNGIRIRVRGALVAEGDESNRVVFKLLDDKRKPHIYLGLRRGKLVLRNTDVYLNIVFSGAYLGSTIVLENTKVTGFLIFETEDTLLDNSELVISNTIILGGVYRPAPITLPPLWKRLKTEWYDIYVIPYIRTNNSVIRVENSIILGGFGVNSELYTGWPPRWMPSNVSIVNSVFAGMFGLDYYLYGPVLTNTTYVYISDSVFIGCTISIEAGIRYGRATSPIIVLRNNSIVNSTVIRLLGLEVDARYNWWGDPAGPYSTRINPLGKGVVIQTVTARAEIIYPWLTAPPREMIKLGTKFEPEPILGKYYFTPVNITLFLEVPFEERGKVLVSYVNISSYGEFVREATVVGAHEHLALWFGKPPLDRDLKLTVITVFSDMRAGISMATIRLCKKPAVEAQVGFVNPIRRTYFEGVRGNTVAESEVKLNAYVYADICTTELLSWLRNNTRVELKLVDLRRDVDVAPMRVESLGPELRLYSARYTFNPTDGLYKAYLYVNHPFGQVVWESEEFYVDAHPPIISAEVLSITREQKTGVYRVALRVSIEEALGATLRIYVNESIVESINLFPGTHDIYFTTFQAGYYLVKLEARDPLDRTSTYNLTLTIAEEKLDTFTTTTPITVQTPYTTTPITTVTTTPTQQVQVAEVHVGYESTAVPLWLILLIILLIILATVLTFLLLRRRKSGKNENSK